jgi:4a-hydroxytetrahydrobiopterin dehydratase
VGLADEHCRSDARELSENEIDELASQIPEWDLEDDVLESELEFETFDDAMSFVNQVADVAKQENHHPDIYISYTDVALTLTTHRVGGLTRNDFIMAAKIDQLLS